ncbi:MAG: UDP-4-amino-4,6-dideoxy-N-acetyl-beta-L-altrosamine transaminase, partial [Fibrobacterota bacterium]|nr:UDP-4-amino-4,6-dideoxy-N-acetyl-beta-L-altrosamine transaminase [Fibrobacterota bacterium]
DHCGANHAVAVCNATAALHIACLASDLGPGDWLWTSPNTFVASANCGLYCGAKVDFVDIDPITLNMDPAALEAKLKDAERAGCLPKVVIPVHFSGLPCDMEKIGALASKYGFTVIEDASHAIGSKYRNVPTGAGTYSAMTVFSFHPVKIVTTGEGGMIVTNRRDLFDRLSRLRTHGITRDPAFMEGESEGPWYYQQVDLGYNYRITDIQAALGESQIKRLDAFVATRNRLADRYDRLLSGLPLRVPGRRADSYSSFHLYVVRVDLGKVKRGRREVFENLRAAGIGVNLHYIPVHLQPYYRKLGFKAGDFPRSEEYYREAISLPLYFDLSEPDQDKVVRSLESALGT